MSHVDITMSHIDTGGILLDMEIENVKDSMIKFAADVTC